MSGYYFSERLGPFDLPTSVSLDRRCGKNAVRIAQGGGHRVVDEQLIWLLPGDLPRLIEALQLACSPVDLLAHADKTTEADFLEATYDALRGVYEHVVGVKDELSENALLEKIEVVLETMSDRIESLRPKAGDT